jgi:hypothetical protein
VPLAHGSAQKDAYPSDNNSGLEKSSSQENGTAGPVGSGPLTMEALRAEVEADIGASGHNTVYDRMLNQQVESCRALSWLRPRHLV